MGVEQYAKKTKDVVIVEAETGRIVFTASGADAEYDYISYSDVKGIHAGDEVMIIDIMSTKNLEADDILNRTDFITDCAAKR